MKNNKSEIVGNFEISKTKLNTRREVLMMGALAASSLVAYNNKANAAVETNKTNNSEPQKSNSNTGITSALEVKEKDFSYLLSKKLDGLSNNQLEQHIKLYKGYVTKTKEINALLDATDILNQSPLANATYSPLRELLMEQSFAMNGVIYHELYFGNLGGNGSEASGELRSALESKFGNYGKFIDYLKAAGKCMRGWVIIAWNTRDSSIHTYGLDTHNIWSPAGIIPLVVLDVYEHAYMIDYGINRASYLDAFVKNIDWDICSKRFMAARKHPSGPDATI